MEGKHSLSILVHLEQGQIIPEVNDWVNHYLNNGVKHIYFFVADGDAGKLREMLVVVGELYDIYSYPTSRIVKEAVWKALGLVIGAESEWLLVCRGNEYVYAKANKMLDVELQKYTAASQVIFPLLKFSRFESSLGCNIVERFRTRFPYKYSTNDILGLGKVENYTSFLHIGTGNVELGIRNHIVRGQVVNLITEGDSYAKWIGGSCSEREDCLEEAIMGNVYDLSQIEFGEHLKNGKTNISLNQLVKMAKVVGEDEAGPIRDMRITGGVL